MKHTVATHVHDSSDYRLHSAILLYSAQSNDVYATLHAVERGKGGTRLGAGIPATAEACAGFVRALSDAAAFSGFIEPRMLYIGPRIAVWHRPPGSARVWFDTTGAAGADQTAAHIGSRTAITPHPGLVFALADGQWHVAAVKGSARPVPGTALHVAPYFNVWRGGHICEGNIRRPDKVTPETIAAFERAFFESRFTHPNMTRLVRFKGGAGALWTALLDGKFKTFPERALLPQKTTLAQWIRQLEKP